LRVEPWANEILMELGKDYFTVFDGLEGEFLAVEWKRTASPSSDGEAPWLRFSSTGSSCGPAPVPVSEMGRLRHN
jgi:hypothetical protein